MRNLLQIQNDLKHLTDAQLEREIAEPGGAAPPYMVLAESSRRSQMRKTHAAEQRRLGRGRTTVAEDLLAQQGGGASPGTGAMAGGSGGMGGTEPAPSGLGAVAPRGGAGPQFGLPKGGGGMPQFADGGRVTGGILDDGEVYYDSLENPAVKSVDRILQASPEAGIAAAARPNRGGTTTLERTTPPALPEATPKVATVPYVGPSAPDGPGAPPVLDAVALQALSAHGVTPPGATGIYGDLRNQLDEARGTIPGQRDNNAASAILQAGLGMLGGTSPNFGENVGRGALPAIASYRAGNADIADRERTALMDAARIQQLEEAHKLSRERLALDTKIANQPKSGGININLAGQAKSYDKERGKNIAENVAALEKKATGSRDMADGFERIALLAADPNIYTGTGGEVVNDLKKLGSTMFGLNLDGVAAAEAVKKIKLGLLGAVREQAGDVRMSDADRKVYLESIPGLSDSPEGIRLMASVMRQMAISDDTRAAKLDEFMRRNPGNVSKGRAEYREWERNHRIWTPELVEQLRANARAGAVRRGPGAGTGRMKFHERYGTGKGTKGPGPGSRPYDPKAFRNKYDLE